MIPKIGITIGDVNGIGPELALKAVQQIDFSLSIPILISPESVLKFYSELLDLFPSIHLIKEVNDAIPNSLNLLQNDRTQSYVPEPGKLTVFGGQIAMQSIQLAVDLCNAKSIDAMVTLPISKEAVNKAGFNIPGHTEFLAEKTNTSDVLMMLVNGNLRVALATVHIPISSIVHELSVDRIIRKSTLLNESLKNDFAINSPRIALLGLNPHAGDGGVIGKEEQTIINPAIESLNQQGIKADGPFPADGFFGQKQYLNYDGVLAMYHDQGLAPFKALSFGKGINFSAGLPIIRTSPDHGTAFNIAGTGKADPSSFLQAYNLAVELAQLNSSK
jgi:4-hydroxythreonine-4-phosphate dehydrogenase